MSKKSEKLFPKSQILVTKDGIVRLRKQIIIKVFRIVKG